MDKNLNKRQIQALKTKENIYETAFNLVEKRGFENITIEEICREAKVSVGTFYNYFKSKDDILNEIFRKADEHFNTTVLHAIKGQCVYEDIVNFFVHYGEYCQNIRVDKIKKLYNTSNTLFIEKGRDMQGVLINIVEKGIRSGQLETNMTAEEMVEYMFIAQRGVIFDWCLHNGNYDLVDFIREYTTRLLKSIN